MPEWWQRASFKFRLTLWYAAITALVLTAFALVQYEVVEHRLASEIDRQLRIDFDLTEAQLEFGNDGMVHSQLRGAHGDEGFARLSAWFDVWSEKGELLLRHWPVPESLVKSSLPPPHGSGLRFYTVELEDGLHARLMERPARVAETGVIVRQFRDETEMRRTLREILEVYFLALPFAVFAASAGGYLMARRALRPVSTMAEHAMTITSKSLSERLPNPNPANEFGQLATVFNDTLERLESSFDELQRFTADASHEMRTPLTALRAVGELAIRDLADARAQREAIASMLEEAQRLDGLIDSLLSLARLESEQLLLTRIDFDAAEVCREVCDTLQLLAVDRRQTISIEGDAPLLVHADRVLLRQALLNIVHNAIRNSSEASSITLHAKQTACETVISITDEGPGIAPEHQARIFDRFFRVDSARTRASGGYGLGLAIAKESIARIGGRIELKSAVGNGSTFRIVVPVNHS
jgi:heavy metal sensor kinase